jgi:L-alanine-DL-glutamate epimerase-like enolase superfamily enzyme
VRWPDGLEGAGEIRTNIAYLTGLDGGRLRDAAVGAVRRFPWGMARPAALLERLDAELGEVPSGARLLVECVLQDAAAREAGTSIAARLTDRPGGAIVRATNQTIFRADPDAAVGRAAAYVERGFLDLKLRVGFGDLDREILTLRRLRARLGPAVRLSADANGRLDRAQALRLAAVLAELGADYLEQPLPAGDTAGLQDLARAAPLPVMLDESAGDLAAVERIVHWDVPVLVHLKLAKLGGIDRLCAAAARLRTAGLGYMVGQMNEGALATAVALQAAVATDAPRAELYGADGLVDDPCQGLRYGRGTVEAETLGVGVRLVGPMQILEEGTSER